jgi:hypothetical protein
MIALVTLIAPLSVSVACVVMGLLSRRLGLTMHVPPYYLGFFVAAGLMLISGAARVLTVLDPPDGTPGLLRVVLVYGLPAIALTLAVILAWRYWSWLLAERS